jgi:hypothetical protein
LKYILFILTFVLLTLGASSQITPGQIRQVTIAGTVVLVKAPSDTSVWNPCIFYHGGSGVSDSISLVTEGDSTLPKRLRQGWWDGTQVIPGGYSSPQSGGSRSTADFWVVMIAQQNGWPPSIDDLVGSFINAHRIDTSFVSFCGWSAGGAYPVQYKTKWNLTNDVNVRKVQKFILCAPGFPNVGDYANFANGKSRIYFDSTDVTTGPSPAYSIHNGVNSSGGNSKIYDVTRKADGSLTGYGHSGIVNPAFRTAGTSANTNNIIWLISETAGNPPPRCATPAAIPVAYDNVIDLEGGSNFYFDSILNNFKGTPEAAGAAVRGERQVYDLYNDSAYYPTSAKGRHILIAFNRMKLVDSIKGFDSAGSSVNVKVYSFRKINASSTVHTTYDSILNANAYAPNYNWSTVGGSFQYRMLQSDMTDTVMYYLFNFYGAVKMSFTFFGCDLPGGATEDLILPVPDTITYTYATVGQLRGSNVTQIGSENFLKDTLKYENEFRFYDEQMYYDTSTSTNPANWKLIMNGAGNMDSIAAVKYGLRSYQSTRGGNGHSVQQNGGGSWEIRSTNGITDNPQIIDNYRRVAKFETQKTAKNGRNTDIQYTRDSLNYIGSDTTHFGLNINIGREPGNEDDKDWLPQQNAKPQHVFAKLAACFDGDRGRMGSKTGIKTMDSTMEVVYPGTVTYRTEWHRASITWSKLYYGDRKIPWDVMGYHIGTSNKLFTISPTASQIVGLKGTYPEYFDDAARNTYVVHLFSRLIGKQAKVYFSEYAVSQEYNWPKTEPQVGAVSILATPLFGSIDNLTTQLNVAWYSAAIQKLRQFLVIAESPAYKAAGYEFHDNSGYKNKTAYAANDQSNGKYTIAPYPTPDTVALWPSFYVVDGFTERMKDYKFERVIAKIPGDIYVTQWRNTVHPDSIAVITRKSDTTGAAINWDLNVGRAITVLKWVPSYTSLTGTQTPITPVANFIAAPSDLMPTIFFLTDSGVLSKFFIRLHVKPNG